VIRKICEKNGAKYPVFGHIDIFEPRTAILLKAQIRKIPKAPKCGKDQRQTNPEIFVKVLGSIRNVPE
jgi:hypothetical protein